MPSRRLGTHAVTLWLRPETHRLLQAAAQDADTSMGELADELLVEALARQTQETIEGPALPAVRQAISQAVEESMARHISRLEHTIRTSGPRCLLGM